MDYRNRPYPNMLRVIRQNLGYQQKEVAKLIGDTNAINLCKWENEQRMPNGTNLMKLCMLYRKTPRELYPQYYQRLQDLLDS